MRPFFAPIFAAAMIFATQTYAAPEPPTPPVDRQHASDLIRMSLVVTLPTGQMTTMNALDLYERMGSTDAALRELEWLIVQNGDQCVRKKYLRPLDDMGLDEVLNHPNDHHIALVWGPWSNLKRPMTNALLAFDEWEEERCDEIIDYGRDRLGWGETMPLAVFAPDQVDPNLNQVGECRSVYDPERCHLRVRLSAALLRSRTEAEMRTIYAFTRDSCKHALHRPELRGATYGMERNDFLFQLFKSPFGETPSRKHVPERFNESLDEARLEMCGDTLPWFHEHPLGTGRSTGR
jgi:hypothetical protein